MDGDGTQAGYDLEFTRAISDAVKLPVVASGGAGTLEHFYEAAVKGGAQILLAASVFHFRILKIKEVKDYLRGRDCRFINNASVNSRWKGARMRRIDPASNDHGY